ncbi:MAG: hypothetical protein U0610_20910 [bacterium]
MPADDRALRFEVSLSIRYTQHGRVWGEGIVTSLTESNLFVQSNALPEVQARVFFALGLGAGATFHGEARVTAHLNRNVGGVTVSGFGLKLDDSAAALAGRIAELERAYPGALSVDADGALVWPVPVDPDILNPGSTNDGLCAWLAGTRHVSIARDAESEHSEAGGGPQLAAWLALEPSLAQHGEARLAFTYRGRALAPTTGAPGFAIHAALRACAGTDATGDGQPPGSAGGSWALDLSDLDRSTDEIVSRAASPTTAAPAPVPDSSRHPLIALAVAQMEVIDTLSSVDWRFQRLGAGELESLGRSQRSLRALAADLASSSSAAALDEGMRRELVHAAEDVAALAARAAWHAAALEPAQASEERYAQWPAEQQRLARQAAQLARAAGDAERPRTGARKERDESRKPSAQKSASRSRDERAGATRDPRRAGDANDDASASRSLPRGALAAGIVGVVLVAGAVAFQLTGRRDPPPETVDVARLRAELQRATPALPVEDARVEKQVLKVVVSPDWTQRTAGERQSDVELSVLVFLALHFDEVRFVTPDGTERARYKHGSFTVADRDASSAER